VDIASVMSLRLHLSKSLLLSIPMAESRRHRSFLAQG